MTAEEKKFMSGRGGSNHAPDAKPEAEAKELERLQRIARESGIEGARRRWGEKHGPTVCVRVFTDEGERFRAHVPQERERAAYATAALKEKMDRDGVPPVPPPCCPPGKRTIKAVLTYHWYGEIEAGRKRIEYREINDYWTDRLWANGAPENIGAICFSKGYTETRMTWEVKRISRNDEEGVFEIHLGRRIS